MQDFVESERDSQELHQDLATLWDEYLGELPGTGAPEWLEGNSPVPYLLWLIDVDRKSPSLKSIQGRIWRQGYESGEIFGEVYDDVEPAIKRWRAREANVSIYSSGSVLAQKLLFGHLRTGSILPMLDNFFDTGVGGKKDSSSYLRIAKILDYEPGEILFLSDNPDEVHAAQLAGMRAIQIFREGVPPGCEGAIDFSGIS